MWIDAALTFNDVAAGLANVGAGDVLVLQLEIPTELVRHAAHLGRKAGAFVILNAAPRTPRARQPSPWRRSYRPFRCSANCPP